MSATAYLMVLALAAGGAPAARHWHDEDHGTKQGHHRDEIERDEDARTNRCLIDEYEVRVISDYYANERRPLPPGLQKKLRRTGHLPPGWQRKIEPLPLAVELRLAPLPHNYRRGVIDGYAVVYDPATLIVIDMAAVFAPD